MLHYYNKNLNSGIKFTLMLMICIWCVAIRSASAQNNAIVKGVVRNTDLSPLPGATIKISGSYTGTSTDTRGEYSLFVKPGNVMLEISFIGNQSKTESFQIAAGETKILNISLSPEVINLKEVSIVNRLDGQQKALNQQKAADNIKNVVSADQMGRFPDQNSAEALQRIPGINVQRDEGDGRFVLVRGLAPQFTNISINGEQIPSPEAGSRFVALDAIPANQLASMEVSKAITPEMDGDAIGGSVNLITQTAYSQNLKISGSASLEYNNGIKKTAPQGNLSVSKRIKGGKFGYILNGTYSASKKGSDRYQYDGWNGDNPDGVDEFVIGDYEINRNRIGASATLDYKFNDHTQIYLRTLFSELRELELRRQFAFETEDDGGLQYDLSKELKDRQENQGVYSISLGGSRIVPKFKVDYEVTYSKAYQKTPFSKKTVFENDEDVSWNIDLHDRLNPRITNFTYGETPTNYTSSNIFAFDSYEHSETNAQDHNFTTKFNVAIPLVLGANSGEFKFGGKMRLKNKDYVLSTFESYGYEGDEDLLLPAFQGSYTDKSFMGGDFGPIGYWPDRNFENFFNAHQSDFENDPATTLEERTLQEYDASENVFAGYTQGKVQFKKLMILGGIRYELTKAHYKSGQWDSEAEEAIPVEGSNDYGFFLPMIHFKYSFSKNTNLRAAATQSYSRPNFQDLVQGGTYDRQRNRASIFNPHLKPVKALNLDLFGEHYLGSVGILSAGVFYKRLDDFIYKQTTNQTFREVPNAQVTQAINGDKATLYGCEIAWQQNFTFLPGFLRGIGIYANYTYTQSVAKVKNFAEGKDITEIDLPGQSKDVGNLSLVYNKGGFSGRASLNFNGKFISSIDGGDLIILDSRKQLDISISQAFLKNKFTAFVELVNLTDENQIQYYNTSDTPERRERYGFWSRMGIKFNL